METTKTFASGSFTKRLTTMLRVDLRRMLVSPLLYIMLGICLVTPILILVMTSMMGGTTVDAVTGEPVQIATFTNTWQAIGTVSGEDAAGAMSLTSMCNINLVYFAAAIFVCLFVSTDFKSGYAKNLFTVRAKKSDYVISKTVVGLIAGAGMLLVFFIGAMLGGAIASLPFATGAAGVHGVVLCLVSKLMLVAVFVPIALAVSVAAKQRTWLSVCGTLAAGMLLFTMIPMLTPLDAGLMNVILCLAGGALFAAGLGAVSNVILKKTALV